jgi:predicted O-methyltransferase YrrM
MSNFERLSAVLAAIGEADEFGIKEKPPEGVLSGFSGEKLIGLLQRLVNIEPSSGVSAYLEIGVFQGLTLLSTALSSPSTICYGIDNFTQFDRDGENFAIVNRRAQRLELKNFEIIDLDFELALDQLKDRIADNISVYFVDGPHDYRSQLVCLGFGVPHLKEGAVLVVDDCNYPHVREATADFLKMFPEFKLVFDAYTSKHPQNMNDLELEEARAGWWNGVHVLVHDPDDLVEGLLPPVVAEKNQFFSDHEVHSMAYGPIAVECLNLVQSFTRPWRMPRAVARLIKNYLKRADRMKGAYPIGNTESSDLAMSRIAKINKATPSVAR